VRCVEESYNSYNMQLGTYKERMLRVYDSVTTFQESKQNAWDTSFKVNKTFEIENKVLPRIIANKPKRQVSVKTDTRDEEDKNLTPEERAKKMESAGEYAKAIKDYLGYVFKKDDLSEVNKLVAKAGIRYGI